MRLGALLGPIGADTVAEQAKKLEAEGFTSVWMPQAIGRGFMLMDPLISLAHAAAVTRLELGTAVLQVPLYHPSDLAHRVFSLQQLAPDRFILGVGAGSTAQDFEAYDRDYDARFATFRTHMAELRETFATGGSLSPWPGVAGGPPIYLGSWGSGVATAAREFDGWIASAHYRTVNQVIDALGRYRESGGGRAIVSTIQLNAETDVGELKEKLDRFAEAGFDDAVVMFLPGAPALDAVRALVA